MCGLCGFIGIAGGRVPTRMTDVSRFRVGVLFRALEPI